MGGGARRGVEGAVGGSISERQVQPASLPGGRRRRKRPHHRSAAARRRQRRDAALRQHLLRGRRRRRAGPWRHPGPRRPGPGRGGGGRRPAQHRRDEAAAARRPDVRGLPRDVRQGGQVLRRGPRGDPRPLARAAHGRGHAAGQARVHREAPRPHRVGGAQARGGGARPRRRHPDGQPGPLVRQPPDLHLLGAQRAARGDPRGAHLDDDASPGFPGQDRRAGEARERARGARLGPLDRPGRVPPLLAALHAQPLARLDAVRDRQPRRLGLPPARPDLRRDGPAGPAAHHGGDQAGLGSRPRPARLPELLAHPLRVRPPERPDADRPVARRRVLRRGAAARGARGGPRAGQPGRSRPVERRRGGLRQQAHAQVRLARRGRLPRRPREGDARDDPGQRGRGEERPRVLDERPRQPLRGFRRGDPGRTQVRQPLRDGRLRRGDGRAGRRSRCATPASAWSGTGTRCASRTATRRPRWSGPRTARVTPSWSRPAGVGYGRPRRRATASRAGSRPAR